MEMRERIARAIRWIGGLFAPKVTVTHWRSVSSNLSPEDEARLWQHFDAAFKEMDQAFAVINAAKNGG